MARSSPSGADEAPTGSPRKNSITSCSDRSRNLFYQKWVSISFETISLIFRRAYDYDKLSHTFVWRYLNVTRKITAKRATPRTPHTIRTTFHLPGSGEDHLQLLLSSARNWSTGHEQMGPLPDEMQLCEHPLLLFPHNSLQPA